MATVPTKLIDIVRSLRPGSAERLIVLRATEQGMENLLKASVHTPVAAPKPTVLPAKPEVTPGGMHIMRQSDGGPAPAALPAAIATQAYVEAGASATRAVPTAERHPDAAANDRATWGAPTHSLDIRPQASLGHAQLPAVIPLAGTTGDSAASGRSGGRDEDQATATDRMALVAIAAAAAVIALLVLAWAALA